MRPHSFPIAPFFFFGAGTDRMTMATRIQSARRTSLWMATGSVPHPGPLTDGASSGDRSNSPQQLMPGAPMPETSAARRMVEARLNQLRGSGPVSGVMTTLAALGEALGQTPDVTIENIAYVNNTTNLRVLAPTTDALDRIRQLATERGLESELKSDNARDQKHEGQLQLKNPGA